MTLSLSAVDRTAYFTFRDQSFVGVHSPDRKTMVTIKEELSYYKPGYFFDPRFKRGIWDGQITFLDKGIFPVGLLPKVINALKQYNIQSKLDFQINEILDRHEAKEEDFLEFFKEGFALRDYQKESSIKALAAGRGVVVAATSAGKSAIIYAVARFLHEQKRKILIMVPSELLVKQLWEDFTLVTDKAGYGWKDGAKHVGLVYSKKKEFHKQIVIGTYQSIMRLPPEELQKFEAVLVDEAHQTKTESHRYILSNLKNAKFRMGFTGTLPKDQHDLACVTGYLGKEIFRIQANELQKDGYISQCKVMNVLIQYPEKDRKFLAHLHRQLRRNIDELERENIYVLLEPPPRKLDYAIPEGVWKDVFSIESNEKLLWEAVQSRDSNILWRAAYFLEGQYIIHSEARNDAFDLVFERVKTNQNALILVQELVHLEKIAKYLEKYGRKIYIIHGKIKPKERERIKKLMEDESGVICLATYGTLSTGVSINNIEHVVLAKSYKSEIRTLQSLGRGLRLRKNKTLCVMWDLVDDFLHRDFKKYQNYGYTHWNGLELGTYTLKVWDSEEPDDGLEINLPITADRIGRLDYYREQQFPYFNTFFEIT